MRKQQGFTVTEMAIIIALGSLLMLISFSVKSAIDGTRADNEVYNLTELSSNLLNFYSVTDGFNGNVLPAIPVPAANANLLSLNLIPAGMIKIDGITKVPLVADEFGGNVTIATILFGSLDPQKPAAVTITEELVPANACIDVIKRIDNKFSVIQVDGTIVKSPTVTFKPIDPVFGPVFTNACNASSTHTIVYTLAYTENPCHNDPTFTKKCSKF